MNIFFFYFFLFPLTLVKESVSNSKVLIKIFHNLQSSKVAVQNTSCGLGGAM